MKNIKIKFKLMISFFVVILLAILVGVMGTFGMYSINKADDDMYEKNYLPTVLIDVISQNIVEQNLIFLNFLVYDVDEDLVHFQNNVNDLNDSIKEMEELFIEYELTIVDPSDKIAFDEFTDVYNKEWLAFAKEIQTLGTENKIKEAKEALMNVGDILAEKMDDLSDILQDFNLSDAKKAVDDNTDLFIRMALIEVAILILTITIAIFFTFYISGLIGKPLNILTGFMKRAGTTGDISLSQDDINNINTLALIKDEIGQCISSTAKFIEHISVISDELEEVSNGNLTIKVNLLSEKDKLGLSVKKMINNLENMFGDINNTTIQVSTSSKQISDGAQMLAQGSTEQAATVQELSTAIADISEKTKKNAEMAAKAASLANVIKHNAEKGSSQMDQMMVAVKEINEASQSINKVIKVIDDIAFQTNILALNAAVEAARAGTAGKGFAVVAEEVRNLASKSAEAAKDTGKLIADSIEKAELGANIAGETAASLNEIVDGINESNKIVAQIANSSEEQSNGITELDRGITQVAQVIQQNSATAEQSAAASEEMSGQAEVLEGLVTQFKLNG